MSTTIAVMPRERKPPTVTVRVNKELARKLRIVAAAQELDVSDYLAKVLEPIVGEELRKLGRSFSDEDGKKKGKS